jgi:glycosyltransferase involved in cell wall biosynthesis
VTAPRGGEDPPPSPVLEVAALPRSLGPHRVADLLAHSLSERGVDARLVEHPQARGMCNVHLANSSRPFLALLARRRGCLVTLHDVVARNPHVRRALQPVVTTVLRRHRVVVHSWYAADLLRGIGYRRDVGIVPLVNPVVVPDEETRLELRRTLLGDREGPLLVLAGVLKASKGVVDAVHAAESVPHARLVLMGGIADAETARSVEEAPANVTTLGAADDVRFSHVLAAADAVLLPRTSFVGETSGPTVMAHALGTPLAMLGAGSAPEYRLPGDLVMPAETPVSHLVAEAAGRRWGRVADTPQAQVGRLLDAYWREFDALGWELAPEARRSEG